MPTQAQINQFIASPEQFLRAFSVRWRGGAPENQRIIDVGMVDRAGTARIRTRSTFLGIGHAKANTEMLELRWHGTVNWPCPPGTPPVQVHRAGPRPAA